MTRIKICGLTRAEDVALCAALGADYVGFNFSARSPRQVAAASAPELRAASDGVRRVGVFVDEDRDAVARAIDALRLDVLQFHRAIRDEDFEFELPVIGVRRVFGSALPDADPLLSRCHAVLFDTGRSDAAGGTGETFDWSVLAASRSGAPAGLAGGLTAANVGEAIRATRPFLVDTASGVESFPGVKDGGRLRAFFAAVRSADAG